MFFVFLILTVISSYVAIWTAMKAIFITALSFFITISIHFCNIEADKVEILKSVGYNPLTTNQVYEMSKKELDNCMKSTQQNIYFRIEE